MKILMYETDSKIQDKVIPLLIEKGYEVEVIQKNDEILPKMSTNVYTLFIYSGDDIKLADTVQSIKSNSSIASIPVILYTSNYDPDFIAKMFSVGICGMILKPFTEISFIKGFGNCIKNVKIDGTEKRKHIRIEPKDVEKTQISFRGIENKLFEGVMKNISMGGVFCEIKGDVPSIPLRSIVKRMRIIVEEYRFSIDSAELVSQNKNSLAFQYKEISNLTKQSMGKYIYKNMSSK